jgi:5'-nucleotidase
MHISFFVVLSLAAFLRLLPAQPVEAQQTLTILHSSEHHGQALPIEERMKPRVGGMAGRATLIAEVRKETGTVLLVDSGDILIGTAISSFFRGEPDIKAMNLMGYQAMAAGNHDFDFGLDHLGKLQEMAQFPILCSNVVGRGAKLPCRPSAVVRIGDLTIGLISLMGHSNFPDTLNRQAVKLLDLRDPIETARTLARRLKADDRVDLVVAVTHEDTDEDLAVLAQVPEVDVVIGGHTEGFDGLRTAGSAEPVESQANPGPVLVKTHRLGRTLGRLDLLLAKPAGGGTTTVVSATARNLPVTQAVPQEPAVSDLLEDYAKKLESQTGVIIGRALVNLDGETTRVRSRETNLGNLLADLLRDEYGTEIALLNGGQIRDSIPVGPVEIKRLLRVLPFNSPTVTLSITGQQLLLALENSVSQLPQTHGRFLQVSGLVVTYDLSAPAGKRVREVTVGERPLDAVRRYSVATDSFMADGGDGFTMFAAATDRIERQVPMRDLLLEALRARPLKASTDGRIRFIGADSGVPDPHSTHPMTPSPEETGAGRKP